MRMRVVFAAMTMNPDGSIKVNWNAETAAGTAAMAGTEVLPYSSYAEWAQKAIRESAPRG